MVVVPEVAKAGVAWKNVDVTLTDERFVPLEHPESNEGSIQRMLEGKPASEANFIGLMSQGCADLDIAADNAEARLRERCPPPFDVVFLGMGPDGHIASLFPRGSWTGRRGNPWIIPDPREYAGICRLSMSPELLMSAIRIHMLVADDAKRERLIDANDGADPQDNPVALLFRAIGANVTIHIVKGEDVCSGRESSCTDS